MDKRKRKTRPTDPAAAAPQPTELTGEALRYAMEHDEELLEATEKGRRAIAEGRYHRYRSTEEIRQRFGDASV